MPRSSQTAYRAMLVGWIVGLIVALIVGVTVLPPYSEGLGVCIGMAGTVIGMVAALAIAAKFEKGGA